MTALTLLVCAGYYVGGVLGVAFRFPPLGISIIWPPNAILLAALLLTPRRTWWVYVLAVLPTHLHLVTHFQPGVPTLTMLSQYTGNIVQALVAAVAIRRFIGAPPRLDTLQSMAMFTLCATAAAAVASALAVCLFMLTGWAAEFWPAWWRRFPSTAFPTLTLTPLLLAMAAGGGAALRNAPPRRYAEAALLAVALLAAGVPAFGMEAAGPHSSPALLYAPLPVLLWAAVRFGVGGACLSLLMIALLSLGNAFADRGPFVTRSPPENVQTLHFFLFTLSLPLLFLAALMAERQRTVAALRANERQARHQLAQLGAIYRTVPIGLVFFDTDLRYVSINDRLAEMNHLPVEAHLGRTLREVTPQMADDLEPLLQRVIATGTPIVDRKVRGTTASQPTVERVWLASYYRIEDDQGVVIGVNAVVQEITARGRVEETGRELARATRLAAVGELTASIAHEVNQPLGAIVSNADAAEMLLAATPPRLDEVRQILADIRKDGARASDVIRHMRALLGNQDVEMRPLDLHTVISDVLRLVEGDARRRGVSLDADLVPRLPTVRGDRVHLQQVLLNLILNGMDAMVDAPDAARRLTVRAHHDGASVEVAVTDTGHGIAPDRLSRLFDSFFTTKREGMGLGLSVARSIIEAHCGRIWAENNPGSGATFRFTLPIEVGSRGTVPCAAEQGLAEPPA